MLLSIWITGSSRSGKTTRLVRKFRQWVKGQLGRQNQFFPSGSRRGDRSSQLRGTVLVFAANDDNRRDLADQLAIAVQGRYPVISKTPLGFISDEVMLFWPLLFERLNLKAQFPLRLRPETEQELATRLWHRELDTEDFQRIGISEYRLVRRTLDLLQLAGASGTPAEDISSILEQGLLEQAGTPLNLMPSPVSSDEDSHLWKRMGELLLGWRQWCLERGLLSYGIIYELYWRYLLSDPAYQQHLTRRYQAIFADDVDDYPTIARDLFEFLLNQGAMGVFTYNPDGKVRLGLNADPNYLASLASRCQVENLNPPRVLSTPPLLLSIRESVVQLATNPTFITSLPACVQSIQTTSRAALLRQTADVIIQSVQRGEIQPEEIVIIAPGLDEIARYTLIEILSHQGISVEPLNEQRPLISSPMIRALLTLLALVYPGLGRLVDRDVIAEMLVVLSWWQEGSTDVSEPKSFIDPVRAGLLADYCYYPDPEQPHLLSVESFPRWDRLGHKATTAYQEIVQWLEEERSRQQSQVFPNAITLLDRAIKRFLWNGSNLPYDQLAALRELMETAQHYWEVDRRLRQNEPVPPSPTATVAQFIQLLRQGTITANPHPVRPLGSATPGAVTLATIFQYRSSRRFHRWHFWLDVSSPLWSLGGAATLFAFPLFLKEWSGRPLSPEDQIQADEQRLQRILRDLLARVGERIYLCHSDLAVNGAEQMEPLLTLVHASMPFVSEEALVNNF